MSSHSKTGVGLAAAIAALGIAGIAGSASAHPHKDGEKVREIIVIKEGGEPGADKAGADKRTFHIERRGPGGPHVRTFSMDGKVIACADGNKVVDHSEDDGKEKTKILICDKGGDPAMRAKHIEEALARINANEHLSAEAKARVTASLREALERSRSAR